MAHAGPRRNPGDPYRVLGVSPDASQRDVARAYRRAVQRAHPDARPRDPQAAARFQALTDAYDLLSDSGRRAAYDRGHPVREPSGQPPPPARAGGRLRRPGPPFLLGPPPGQLIWAGSVHIEPPATTPRASQHGRTGPAAESDDPVVILGVRPGQVWGWPW
jgi:curved DNA-binding protein CbpA